VQTSGAADASKRHHCRRSEGRQRWRGQSRGHAWAGYHLDAVRPLPSKHILLRSACHRVQVPI